MKRMMRRGGLVVLLTFAVYIPAWAASIPVIYCTDLFHPPQDPDDHYDLATLFALPELDIRAIVFDQGLEQKRSPGSIPLRQMMRLTGRNVPYVLGLQTALRYPEDKALNQFTQEGPEMILQVLRESPQKVRMITTGSVRDVAAAFNRDPALFHSKVDRIYVNDGNSGGGDLQWNPRLDPQAYLRLMRSDLPIYWAPGFGGKETLAVLAARKLPILPYQAYWIFRQDELFGSLPDPLKNYLFYALAHEDPAVHDPIAWLASVPDSSLEKKLGIEYRNMWSTVTLLDAAGRRPYRRGASWVAAASPSADDVSAQIYEFTSARIRVDADLHGFIEGHDARSPIRVFHILDTDQYQPAMLSILRRLLGEMTLQN